tara:strand:- start:4224 stop:4967 length:744 start_codon:yes stop_codon:yes gene_type:complete
VYGTRRLDLDLLHEGALTIVQTNRAVTSVEDDLAVHLVKCSAFLPQKILSSLTHHGHHLSLARELKDEDCIRETRRISVLFVDVERKTIELLDRSQEISDDRIIVAKEHSLLITTTGMQDVLAQDGAEQTIEVIVRSRREIGLGALAERRPELFDVNVKAPLGVAVRVNAGRHELSSNDIFESHRQKGGEISLVRVIEVVHDDRMSLVLFGHYVIQRDKKSRCLVTINGRRPRRQGFSRSVVHERWL